MAYKTITVHLDNVDKAPGLIAVASQLADKHKSHLIGTFILHPLDPYVARVSDASLSSNFAAIVYKDQLERMAQLKTLFMETTENQSFESEWRFVENKNESLLNVLTRQAAMTDLLILGYDKSNNSGNEYNALVEKTLLDSPVPVLIVPDGYQGEISGGHVMAGWDARTGTRRAISAAMPFLKHAKNVWLYRVTKDNNEGHFEHNDDIELATTLSRHGVTIELATGAGASRIVGEALLAEAKLRGVNLVVAGAFGHARIRDIILGSTTQYLLKNADIPLLMVH